jgi:hypothetical protein
MTHEVRQRHFFGTDVASLVSGSGISDDSEKQDSRKRGASMGKGNQALYTDFDFDAQGHVVKNVAAQAEMDPILHYIVKKILRGESITQVEKNYYDRMAPEFVKSEPA